MSLSVARVALAAPPFVLLVVAPTVAVEGVGNSGGGGGGAFGNQIIQESPLRREDEVARLLLLGAL